MKKWRGHPVLDNDDRGAIPRLDVSLKVSSFYSQLDPIDWDGSVRSSVAGLAEVFDRAQQARASITVDMEHYHIKDLTIDIFMRALEEHPDLQFGGIALQAYLKETKDDVVKLIDWARKAGRRIAVAW
jgi:RHH-type proline utilization regulon transcriptional repressor/proline dehydrogenase/delta 1-pyrroline-5-carboxylate dehydrogenase